MEIIEMINELTPVFIILAFSMMVVLVTSILKAETKASIQSTIFAVMMASSVLCLTAATDKTGLQSLLNVYSSQPNEIKLALAGYVNLLLN